MTRAWFADVVIDPDGRPIPLVTVDVFEPGTITPIAGTIYATAANGSTRTNPFTTNSQGELEFWLAEPKRVDLRYSKSGEVTETHTVEVLAAAPPASTVVVTPTGAIGATNVQSALAELDTEKSATTHAHSGTYVASTGPVIIDATVSPYSADKTGVADARAAINLAIDAAYALGGGTVFLPAGTYKIASSPGIVLKANVTLAGSGEGTLIDQRWWSGVYLSGLINASGTYTNTDAAVLSVDAAPRATTLTCTSTAGLVAGEWYILGDDRSYMDSTDVDTGDVNRYRGEMVRIFSIDSGTVVTLYGVVKDNYVTASAASLRLVGYIAGVGLRDLRITNPEPDAHSGGHVYFSFCKSFAIERVSVEHTDGPGIHLDNCLDGTVANCRAFDLTDNDPSGRYGYATIVNRATENIVISGLKVRGGRHAFTTNGVDFRRGVPRNITVIGGVANYSHQTAWDTHTQGAAISFVDCHALNGKASAGFNLRSPDTKIIGGSVSYCQTGIQAFFPAHGSQVRGCVIRHTDLGLSLGGVEQFVFDGNTIDGTKFYGISIGGACGRATISRNHIWNMGQSGTPAPGIRVVTGATGTGNKILNNTIGATGTSNSEAASTGLLQNPIEIVPTGSLGYVIEGNRSIAALGTPFVLDGSTGAIKANNQFLETYTDPVLTVDGLAGPTVTLASDGAAGTATKRTLGTSATSAAAGNDARLSDTRTPTDATVTNAKVATTANIDAYKVLDPDGYTSGESVFGRDLANSINTGTGNLRLGYFTAKKTETVTQVKIFSTGTAAGATPTLVRVGVWTADVAGALISQVATTPNDTALLATLNTTYTKSFSSSFGKVAGQRYAVGLLVVTAATAPSVCGNNMNGALPASEASISPKRSGLIGGLADLPASAAAGGVADNASRLYAVLLP